MVGRIPILNVMPVVDLGRQAAKATVGEPMPVSATVFREGHDKLGAEVVATDPRGVRREPVPDGKHPERPRLLRGLRSRPTSRDRGPSRCRPGRPDRHLAARGRPEDPGRRRRRADVHRGRGCCSSGSPARSPRRTRRRSWRAPSRPPRTPGAPSRPGWPPCSPPSSPGCWPRTRCASWSPSRGPTRCSPTGSARCSAPGTSSSRAPRAPPSTRRRARSPAAPSAPPCPASTTPPTSASTSSTCRRSTRSARSTARAPTTPSTPGRDDTGSPWAIGSKRRRPRHDPPRPRHLRGLRRLRRPRPGPRAGDRPRPRPPVRARPPVGRAAPRVVHHPRRRHDRLRREPAQEVPGHLPGQLRQRPDRHLPRGAADRQALDVARRARSSAWTTRTPSRWRSGSGCCARCGAPTPTCCSWPRRSPAPR